MYVMVVCDGNCVQGIRGIPGEDGEQGATGFAVSGVGCCNCLSNNLCCTLNVQFTQCLKPTTLTAITCV